MDRFVPFLPPSCPSWWSYVSSALAAGVVAQKKAAAPRAAALWSLPTAVPQNSYRSENCMQRPALPSQVA